MVLLTKEGGGDEKRGLFKRQEGTGVASFPELQGLILGCKEPRWERIFARSQQAGSAFRLCRFLLATLSRALQSEAKWTGGCSQWDWLQGSKRSKRDLRMQRLGSRASSEPGDGPGRFYKAPLLRCVELPVSLRAPPKKGSWFETKLRRHFLPLLGASHPSLHIAERSHPSGTTVLTGGVVQS